MTTDDGVLNSTFDLSRADPRHIYAFAGTPRKVRFNRGDRLFRFVSLPQSGFGGNEVFRSPWWYPQQTFNSLVRTAHRTGSSLPDTARSRLAVTKEWNPTMGWLAIIELTAPVYGWVGRTAPQPAQTGDRSVILLGNFDQVYLPGLAGPGDGQSSPYAFVQYYGQPD